MESLPSAAAVCVMKSGYTTIAAKHVCNAGSQAEQDGVLVCDCCIELLPASFSTRTACIQLALADEVQCQVLSCKGVPHQHVSFHPRVLLTQLFVESCNCQAMLPDMQKCTAPEHAPVNCSVFQLPTTGPEPADSSVVAWFHGLQDFHTKTVLHRAETIAPSSTT